MSSYRRDHLNLSELPPAYEGHLISVEQYGTIRDPRFRYLQEPLMLSRFDEIDKLVSLHVEASGMRNIQLVLNAVPQRGHRIRLHIRDRDVLLVDMDMQPPVEYRGKTVYPGHGVRVSS